jgi:arylsulfatase A-like enzyme
MKPLFISIFLLLLAVSSSQAAKKPNIIFILTDDQALETISALGNSGIKTPNIDSLIKTGVTFTNASNMGSWADNVSLASRTMMFTGKFLWPASKIKDNQDPSLIRNFKDGGYQTYGTGAWHAEEKGGMSSAFDNVLDTRAVPLSLEETKTPFTAWNHDQGAHWENGTHVTNLTGESAISLLKKATSQEKPFFLYVGFNAPALPWQYEQKELKRIKSDQLSLPPGIKNGHFYFKQKWPKVINPKFVSNRYRDYYLVIERLDRQLGRILDALKKSGAYENTIIAFLSDNGFNNGENGIMGCQNLYEKSLKAPLILVGPHIPKNKFIDSCVYLQDVLPTLMQLAEIPRPELCQFRSFVPQMKGKETGPWEDILGAYRNDMRSIKVDDHKLVLYRRKTEHYMKLYNLIVDPFELNDLSQKKSSSNIIEDCLDRLQRWETNSGGTLKVRDYFAQPAVR